MDTVINLGLSDGYVIREKCETVDTEQACRLMASRKQLRYTKAEKSGDSVILTRHVLVCPYCGKVIPAYGHFLSHQKRHSKKSAQEIADWIWPQTTLFGTAEQSTISFFQPEQYDDAFHCPKCMLISYPASQTVFVSICSTEKSVCINRKINDISELMNIGWIPVIVLTTDFPLQETLTFDFQTGSSVLQLTDSCGNVLYNTDLTLLEQLPQRILSFDLCERNKVAKRCIRRAFMRCWGSLLPFDQMEFSLETLVLMTKYIGFPRCFYDAIPYKSDSFNIEKSFADISQTLHNSSDAITLYHNSALPHAKSIRKLFFQNPGLFFYIRECEVFCSIIKDINLLHKFFTSSAVFEVLATIHLYPGIALFLEDYCKVKGAYTLCHRLIEYPKKLCGQAILYHSMNEARRGLEAANWKHRQDNSNSFYRNYVYISPECSIPMHPIHEDIKNCHIHGYDFIWLRTNRDYIKAGTQLNNCLKDWISIDNPVVGIFKNSRILAAIEVDENTVVQVCEYKNRCISIGSSIFDAFSRWYKKNNLVLKEGLSDRF